MRGRSLGRGALLAAALAAAAALGWRGGGAPALSAWQEPAGRAAQGLPPREFNAIRDGEAPHRKSCQHRR